MNILVAKITQITDNSNCKIIAYDCIYNAQILKPCYVKKTLKTALSAENSVIRTENQDDSIDFRKFGKFSVSEQDFSHDFTLDLNIGDIVSAIFDTSGNAYIVGKF
jgi:hypothetical protein